MLFEVLQVYIAYQEISYVDNHLGAYLPNLTCGFLMLFICKDLC